MEVYSQRNHQKFKVNYRKPGGEYKDFFTDCNLEF